MKSRVALALSFALPALLSAICLWVESSRLDSLMLVVGLFAMLYAALIFRLLRHYKIVTPIHTVLTVLVAVAAIVTLLEINMTEEIVAITRPLCRIVFCITEGVLAYLVPSAFSKREK